MTITCPIAAVMIPSNPPAMTCNERQTSIVPVIIGEKRLVVNLDIRIYQGNRLYGQDHIITYSEFTAYKVRKDFKIKSSC